MKRLILSAAAVFVALAVSASPKPKYVFYLIGDGMGVNTVYGTMMFNRSVGIGPKTLNFWDFPVRTFITTYSASSLTTDSAAAGTALATGSKTYNDAMGVGPDTLALTNIAEWAKASGAGVGIATSVPLNHATPSAFYAHTKSRNDHDVILNQYIGSKVDFIAGSGILTEEKRTGRNSAALEALVREAGVRVLYKDEFDRAGEVDGRVMCLGKPGTGNDLTYAVDRREGDVTLGDFVKAGIDYLSANYMKEGFFFMIEGGNIDHAAHNEDAYAAFGEINDFAATIDIVLDFYRKHPDNTLIVVTSDHDTGSFIASWKKMPDDKSTIARQHGSEDGINADFREFLAAHDGNIPDWEEAKDFLGEHLGLWRTVKVSAKAEESLKRDYYKSLGGGDGSVVVSLYSVSTLIVSKAIDYLNNVSGFEWGHGSHSSTPVGLYAIGSRSGDLAACRDNTDVPRTIAAAAGYKVF